MSDPVWAPPGSTPGPHPDNPSAATPTGSPHGDAARQREARPGSVRSDVVVVLGSFLVLGVLCGVLWWVLAPEPQFTKSAAGGEMGELDLGKQFGIDGWYVVVAAVAGLLSGLVLSWWRDRDPLLTSGLLLVGSAIAAVLMSLVGHLLGPGDAQAALAKAAVGARVPTQIHVDAMTAYLAWPITVLVGALVVLWGRLPDSDL